VPNPNVSGVALVLPTYNERENLPSLIAAIRGLDAGINVIVVDDGSPDGTGELADALATQVHDIEVIHRPR
jgi:dolichol-phosphate mannosyltransferase